VCRSGEDVHDWHAFVSNRERTVGRRHDHFVHRKTHGVTDGSLEVLGRDLTVSNTATILVRRAVNETTFDAAAREDGGISEGVMIAAIVLIDVRRAAKL
jgi:hypothetical protein